MIINVIIYTFQVFLVKKHFKLTWKFRIKILFNISVLLICQKPANFLSGQMASVSTFFHMFIVLGMYNFDLHWPNLLCLTSFKPFQISFDSKSIYDSQKKLTTKKWLILSHLTLINLIISNWEFCDEEN